MTWSQPAPSDGHALKLDHSFVSTSLLAPWCFRRYSGLDFGEFKKIPEKLHSGMEERDWSKLKTDTCVSKQSPSV